MVRNFNSVSQVFQVTVIGNVRAGKQFFCSNCIFCCQLSHQCLYASERWCTFTQSKQKVIVESKTQASFLWDQYKHVTWHQQSHFIDTYEAAREGGGVVFYFWNDINISYHSNGLAAQDRMSYPSNMYPFPMGSSCEIKRFVLRLLGNIQGNYLYIISALEYHYLSSLPPPLHAKVWRCLIYLFVKFI